MVRPDHLLNDFGKPVNQYLSDNIVLTIREATRAEISDRVRILFLGNEDNPEEIDAMQLHLAIEEVTEKAIKVPFDRFPKR